MGGDITSEDTVGTCSLCGGAVVVPRIWYGVGSPIPKCSNCGATKAKPNGPIIDMINPTTKQKYNLWREEDKK